jgi:hypothetical protein
MPTIECIHHPLYLEDVFTGERIDELSEGSQGLQPEWYRPA